MPPSQTKVMKCSTLHYNCGRVAMLALAFSSKRLGTYQTCMLKNNQFLITLISYGIFFLFFLSFSCLYYFIWKESQQPMGVEGGWKALSGSTDVCWKLHNVTDWETTEKKTKPPQKTRTALSTGKLHSTNNETLNRGGKSTQRERGLKSSKKQDYVTKSNLQPVSIF